MIICLTQPRMIYVWFGLDGTGIQKSVEMHKILGPVLMTLFAFLGNTLFLTILVAMLSDTYSKLAKNATQEIQYRRAVLTFEGVKSDALFSYPPPFNVLFLFVLLPLKLTASPRWFHKLNVVFVRTLNAPVLLLISLYERQYLWKRRPGVDRAGIAQAVRHTGHGGWFDFFESLGAHADLQLVFEQEPPQWVLDELDETDQPLTDEMWKHGFGDVPAAATAAARARRASWATSEGGSVFPNLRRRFSRGNEAVA